MVDAGAVLIIFIVVCCLAFIGGAVTYNFVANIPDGSSTGESSVTTIMPDSHSAAASTEVVEHGVTRTTGSSSSECSYATAPIHQSDPPNDRTMAGTVVEDQVSPLTPMARTQPVIMDSSSRKIERVRQKRDSSAERSGSMPRPRTPFALRLDSIQIPRLPSIEQVPEHTGAMIREPRSSERKRSRAKLPDNTLAGLNHTDQQRSKPKIPKVFSFHYIKEALKRRQTERQSWQPVPLPFLYVFEMPTGTASATRKPISTFTSTRWRKHSCSMQPRQPSVLLFEVPESTRQLVHRILEDYTGTSIPKPYFLLLVNASFAAGRVTAKQLRSAEIIGSSTTRNKLVPRFSGALLTVLSYNRHGHNGLIDFHSKHAAKAIEYEAPNRFDSQMFHGLSILIPDNHSPWTEIECLEAYNLLKRIAKPIPKHCVSIMSTEAQMSAALRSHAPSMAVLGKRELHHVYNGWLLFMEPLVRSPLVPDGANNLLREGHDTFRKRCKESTSTLVCQSVKDFMQDCFEAEVQNVLDNIRSEIITNIDRQIPQELTGVTREVKLLTVDKCDRALKKQSSIG